MRSSPHNRDLRPRPRALLPWTVGWVLTLAACGGALAPQEAPSDTAVTVEGAEASFDEAEQDLQAVLGERESYGYGEQSGGDALEPPAADRPSELSQHKSLSRAEGRCERACRALASMTRSADRLCELTGEGDSRCDGVRQRVRAAGDLVASFCSACE
jgi:hypothetical protein